MSLRHQLQMGSERTNCHGRCRRFCRPCWTCIDYRILILVIVIYRKRLIQLRAEVAQLCIASVLRADQCISSMDTISGQMLCCALGAFRTRGKYGC